MIVSRDILTWASLLRRAARADKRSAAVHDGSSEVDLRASGRLCAHYRHSGAVGLISEAVICCRMSVVELGGKQTGGFGCAMLNG